MEKQLSFVSILSLQEMTLRKVAVALWTEPNTLVSVASHRFGPIYKSDHLKNWYETVESQVSYKSSKLQLPESVVKQLLQIIKPIGLQILGWKLHHESNLNPYGDYFDVPILEKLQWTAAGSVDYRKTAEELVGSYVLDIVKRYKLACLYCLCHYILELKKELSQERKKILYNETIPAKTNRSQDNCWPYILKEQLSKLDSKNIFSISFNEFLFQHSSSELNVSAIKYFLQKLSPEQRETSLIMAAESALGTRRLDQIMPYFPFPNKHISDIVFYSLSQLTPEQQIQIFRESPADVFRCFFDWPWQDAFLEFADALWTSMQCEDLVRRTRNYNSLLGVLVESIRFSDYYLPNLFQNFFKSSPNDFKKHFVDTECRECRIFIEVFSIHDAETVIVILRNLDSGDKLRLASSERILDLFYFTISKGRWSVVEMFIREARLSKEDKAGLKESFMELEKRKKGGPIESGRFFELLNENDTKAKNKRSFDD